MASRKHTEMKNRNKALRKGNKLETTNFEDLETIDKIKTLQSYIKNCQYDLISQPENTLIKNKILNFKKQILELENKLQPTIQTTQNEK